MASSDPGEVFRERLGALLRKRGMTQRKLAEKIGANENTVRRWLSGESTNPALDSIVGTGRALGVPPAYLLADADDLPALARLLGVDLVTKKDYEALLDQLDSFQRSTKELLAKARGER